MKQKLVTIVKYVLSIALAAVLLYFSFRGVDWISFKEALSSCRWGFVFLSMLAGALAFIVRGFRWRQILAPIDPDTKNISAINGVNIANVANMVIPYSGEFVRCGVITRHSTKVADQNGRMRPRASYDKVLGTALLERTWDIVSVIILLALLLVFMSGRFGAFMAEKVWQPVSNSFRGSMGLLVAACIAAFAGGLALIFKYKDRNRFCGRIYGALKRFGQGFVSCLHIDHVWLFFLYTAIIWCMYWMQMVFITSALPQLGEMGAVDALFIMLVGSFATCMPVPGGFGAYHYIVSIALFSLYGIPQAGLGIVFATLSHESQALTMLVTGLASYICESFRK